MSAARRSLRQTELDPRRQAVRRRLLYAALGLTTLLVLMVLFERHRTQHREWHPITDEEEGLVALVTLGSVWLAILGASRLGFASGLFAGIAALLGGLITAVALAMNHLLSDVTRNASGELAVIGCLGLSGLGLAIFIVELVLRGNQRADDRRASPEPPEPQLPRAIAIEGGRAPGSRRR